MTEANLNFEKIAVVGHAGFGVQAESNARLHESAMKGFAEQSVGRGVAGGCGRPNFGHNNDAVNKLGLGGVVIDGLESAGAALGVEKAGQKLLAGAGLAAGAIEKTNEKNNSCAIPSDRLHRPIPIAIDAEPAPSISHANDSTGTHAPITWEDVKKALKPPAPPDVNGIRPTYY